MVVAQQRGQKPSNSFLRSLLINQYIPDSTLPYFAAWTTMVGLKSDVRTISSLGEFTPLTFLFYWSSTCSDSFIFMMALNFISWIAKTNLNILISAVSALVSSFIQLITEDEYSLHDSRSACTIDSIWRRPLDSSLTNFKSIYPSMSTSRSNSNARWVNLCSLSSRKGTASMSGTVTVPMFRTLLCRRMET